MRHQSALTGSLLVTIQLLSASPCFADLIVRELGRENGEPEPYVFPYGFASEATRSNVFMIKVRFIIRQNIE